MWFYTREEPQDTFLHNTFENVYETYAPLTSTVIISAGVAIGGSNMQTSSECNMYVGTNSGGQIKK